MILAGFGFQTGRRIWTHPAFGTVAVQGSLRRTFPNRRTPMTTIKPPLAWSPGSNLIEIPVGLGMASQTSMDQDQPIDPDRWVDDHGDALYGYAMLRLRDADRAAEVVQETFLEALRGRARSRGGRASGPGWSASSSTRSSTSSGAKPATSSGAAASRPSTFESGEFFDERGGWKVPSADGPSCPTPRSSGPSSGRSSGLAWPNFRPTTPRPSPSRSSKGSPGRKSARSWRSRRPTSGPGSTAPGCSSGGRSRPDGSVEDRRDPRRASQELSPRAPCSSCSSA